MPDYFLARTNFLESLCSRCESQSRTGRDTEQEDILTPESPSSAFVVVRNVEVRRGTRKWTEIH